MKCGDPVLVKVGDVSNKWVCGVITKINSDTAIVFIVFGTIDTGPRLVSLPDIHEIMHAVVKKRIEDAFSIAGASYA